VYINEISKYLLVRLKNALLLISRKLLSLHHFYFNESFTALIKVRYTQATFDDNYQFAHALFHILTITVCSLTCRPKCTDSSGVTQKALRDQLV